MSELLKNLLESRFWGFRVTYPEILILEFEDFWIEAKISPWRFTSNGFEASNRDEKVQADAMNVKSGGIILRLIKGRTLFIAFHNGVEFVLWGKARRDNLHWQIYQKSGARS